MRRQDELDAGAIRSRWRAAFRRDVVVVESRALVEGDAGQADQVRGTHAPSSDRWPAPPGRSPRAPRGRHRACGRQHAEIGGKPQQFESHGVPLVQGQRPSMEWPASRPAIRSAVMRAEPCDMVQPIWPWPVLRKRLRMPPAPEDRQIVGRHRPQPSPHLGAIIVGAIGIEFLRHRLHEGEVGGLVAGVVAGELRRRGDADAVAEARDRDEIVLVDGGDGRRRLAVADRDRQRIALDRIDRQTMPILRARIGL